MSNSTAAPAAQTDAHFIKALWPKLTASARVRARAAIRLAENADTLRNANSGSYFSINAAVAAIAEHEGARDNSHFRTAFSGNDEWRTPARLLEPVRHVLGAIDLDPASNDIAQRQVRARNYFTKEDDALTREWHGKIFLNPPYSFPAIERFIDKLLDELRAGRVTEAVVLTNDFSDTAWFHKAALSATAICFTKGRIVFESAEGSGAQPTQGQAFFYFGPHLVRFREAFADQGLIMLPDAGAAP
jgi:phage N-6-adenine-methyltransferase